MRHAGEILVGQKLTQAVCVGYVLQLGKRLIDLRRSSLRPENPLLPDGPWLLLPNGSKRELQVDGTDAADRQEWLRLFASALPDNVVEPALRRWRCNERVLQLMQEHAGQPSVEGLTAEKWRAQEPVHQDGARTTPNESGLVALGENGLVALVDGVRRCVAWVQECEARWERQQQMSPGAQKVSQKEAARRAQADSKRRAFLAERMAANGTIRLVRTNSSDGGAQTVTSGGDALKRATASFLSPRMRPRAAPAAAPIPTGEYKHNGSCGSPSGGSSPGTASPASTSAASRVRWDGSARSTALGSSKSSKLSPAGGSCTCPTTRPVVASAAGLLAEAAVREIGDGAQAGGASAKLKNYSVKL